MELLDQMRRSLRLFLVQKHIFCPLSGKVLDIDTARFVLDADGDPYLPLDPDAAALIEGAIERGEHLLKDGYTLEPAKGAS